MIIAPVAPWTTGSRGCTTKVGIGNGGAHRQKGGRRAATYTYIRPENIWVHVTSDIKGHDDYTESCAHRTIGQAVSQDKSVA